MEEEMELDLREIFGIIRKRIGLILIITTISVFVAGLISMFVLSPVYEAKAEIIVSNKTGEDITSSDVSMYQNLMQTYKAIAATNKVAEIAADDLDTGITAKELLQNTTITAQTGTMILDISVQSNSAVEAYKGAQAMSNAFIKRATYLMTAGDVTIMDDAKFPENPIKPNTKMNLAIAFVLGLLVSIGIAFLIEYLDNTIKTENDIEKYLGVSIIGNIPKYDLD
ncbi:MAG: YveK family protein [Clostridiaceae bacterium]